MHWGESQMSQGLQESGGLGHEDGDWCRGSCYQHDSWHWGRADIDACCSEVSKHVQNCKVESCYCIHMHM